MKKHFHLIVSMCIVFQLQVISNAAMAEGIGGSPDQSSGNNWQSAYVDIDPPRDFRKGEQLRIKVQGSAEWVRVRLLPQSGAYDKPTGLIGGKIKIPPNGVLSLVLSEDRAKVKQVSVHAGELAWGELLNPSGGTVEIVSIDVSSP